MNANIPIVETDEDDDSFVPQGFSDDPISGDGSVSRGSVEVSGWAIRTLGDNRMGSLADAAEGGRRGRRARRRRAASRRARSGRRRITRRRLRTFFGFVVVALLVGAAAVALTYALEIWGGHTVPNVIGVSEANARTQLEDAGFSVAVERVAADEVSGHVIEMSPAALTRQEPGTQVVLQISESRTIPEVVGLTREQARAALEEAGAQNLRFQSSVLFEEEDRVLAVEPEEGSVFMSSDEVTLIVAERPTVPAVAGMSEAEAREALQRESIAVTLAFEDAGVEGRLVAQRTEPAAGERADEEGVKLFLGDPLVSVGRVADYFDATCAHVDEFLVSRGLLQRSCYRDDKGHLIARYADSLGTTVTFRYDPWTDVVADRPAAASMDESARVEGVRLSVTPVAEAEVALQREEADEDWWEGTVVDEPVVSLERAGISEAACREVVEALGLGEVDDVCTNTTIRMPSGQGTPRHQFVCCSGTSGVHVWTVLVRGSAQQASEVVVSCLSKAAWEEVDLTPFGGKVCNFVAFQEEVAER